MKKIIPKDRLQLSVLVIDDKIDMLNLQRILLETEGFEVFCAQTSDEALAVLSKMNEPNIILLDIEMQDITGNEFLRLLEESNPEIIKNVPIIFLADNNENHINGIMNKPIEADRLLKEVHNFIEKKYHTPLVLKEK